MHPRLGPIDPGVVAEALLSAIGGGQGVERVVELAWRDAGLVRVERRAPLATQTGKIRHRLLARRDDRPVPRPDPRR